MKENYGKIILHNYRRIEWKNTKLKGNSMKNYEQLKTQTAMEEIY